ncbi:PCYCGC motif-containing (lipo)protein [Staphylospora marina]|uniref:PCYCGC motif-containing (lipo)protein n=1 Tax=Staphylospora marina TaxID=2490858 RepID=UPI0013DE34EF|nr:PCYCGC motif-containing (lipo)protein [Staphylospora marina]
MKKRKATKWLLLLGGMLMTVHLTGCAAEPDSGHTSEHHSSTEHVAGDLREETGSVRELPSFLSGADPWVVQVYQTAAENASLLDHIPCYCGCGQSVGHRSNRDCFVHEIKSDGNIVWDSHGTKCGTCLEIAEEAAALKKQGKSVKEIREYIDQKYKEGYAPPTPTPMPS